MRNQKFEDMLETVALEFSENLEKYHEIISIHHTDADGISSGAIVRKMLTKLKIPFKQFPNNLEKSWSTFLDELLPKIKTPCGIICSDCGPSGDVILEFLTKISDVDFYILDHHIFQHPTSSHLPDSVYLANPTEFGLNGLKEIAGATLNYLFSKIVDEKNQNLAWIAAIGMGGDTLEHYDNYQSYNKQVIDEAAELGQIEIKKGLCLYGGQFESLNNALAHSILPFIPEIEGNPKIAKDILQKIGIDWKKKSCDLSDIEISSIAAYFQNPSLIGQFITFPKKEGLFHYSFEHAQLISLIGHDNPDFAYQLLGRPRITAEAKKKYINFINTLVLNLSRFVKIPKEETKTALLVDTRNQIESSLWSDIGSFSSINGLFDSHKMLFIGGVNQGTMKLSVRCNQKFIEEHHGSGVNVVIKKILSVLDGNGGGHGLAGGMRIAPDDFPLLVSKIDDIIQNAL